MHEQEDLGCGARPRRDDRRQDFIIRTTLDEHQAKVVHIAFVVFSFSHRSCLDLIMSLSRPSTQKAVICKAKGIVELESSYPVPSDIKPGYLLIKTVAVALNPTDYKSVDGRTVEGALVGCDYSGTVEKLGPGITKDWKVGDRIAGFAHTVNALDPRDGAFAEYVLAKADIQIRIPDSLSFEEAATLGAGIVTVGQALYQALKLPLPPYRNPAAQGNPPQILIYGGSTATGSLAIQFAKLSGFTVITTSSSSSFDLCKSRGSTMCFDYNDPSCGREIHAHAIEKDPQNGLHYVLDTITSSSSMKICSEALSSHGPNRYCALAGVSNFPLRDSDQMEFCGFTIAYTAKGEALQFGESYREGKVEDFEFMRREWIPCVERLLLAEDGGSGSGQVKVHPVEIGKGGLAGVEAGLQAMREGKVRGVKMVYRISDTP